MKKAVHIWFAQGSANSLTGLAHPQITNCSLHLCKQESLSTSFVTSELAGPFYCQHNQNILEISAGTALCNKCERIPRPTPPQAKK